MELNVTVKSALPFGDPQGEFPVIISEDTTVGLFIRKVCKDNGITMRSSITLKNSLGQDLRWSSTLREALVISGATLYLHDNENGEAYQTKIYGCNLWWYIGALSLVIGLVGLISINILHHVDQQPVYNYGIVLDAGSSHTKLFIYKWDGNKYKDTALAKQDYVCSVPGAGISSYVENPEGIKINLQKCLSEAEDVVPADKHDSTPLYLGATAGMRLIQAVNNTVSERILQVVRDTIKAYKFQFTNPENQARIITGAEEGLFSWVTSNYILGKFGVVPPTQLRSSAGSLFAVAGEGTVGALDLGGASTQITFYPGDVSMPGNYSGGVQLYGKNYTVYTNSYLCFGINEITRKYKALLVKSQNFSETVINPCGPKGNVTVDTYSEVFEAPCTKDTQNLENIYMDKNTTFTFQGTSNVTQCMETVRQLFDFNKTCPYGNNCSFNGTYQPPVHGQFYAFSNFFYEMDFLNLTQTSPITSLKSYKSAVSSLCIKSWKQIKDMRVANPVFLPWYCFRGSFIQVLLNEAYKFNEESWRNIRFINKLKNTEIGWSLGFMINSSTHIPPESKDKYLSNLSFALLLTLFVIFILIAVGFACHAVKYHKLKKRGMYQKLENYGSV